MTDRTFWNTPDVPGEEPRRLALFSSIVRSVVEKYGGGLELDLVSHTVVLDIPSINTAACIEELQDVLRPIKG